MWRRALIGVAIICGSAGPSQGMSGATTHSGVDIGIGVGSITTPGYTTKQLGTLDVTYGIKTNYLGVPYTHAFFETFSVSSTGLGSGISTGLGALGFIQPLFHSSIGTVSLEGGVSAFTVERVLYYSQTEGGFAGLRASVPENSRFKLNAMARFYAVRSGGWQAGLGLVGPITRRLRWQIDFNHFANGKSNTVVFGVRWLIPTESHTDER